MADGVERIYGYLADAVTQTHSHCSYGVQASSSPHEVGGQISTGETADGNLVPDVADIRFSMDEDSVILAEIKFDPERAAAEDVLFWAKAVWEGAASKGFPGKDWKW